MGSYSRACPQRADCALELQDASSGSTHQRVNSSRRKAELLLEQRYTLRDSALPSTIPALYVGAFALRFFHLLP